MLTVSQKALQQLAALLLERAGLKITPDGYHSLRLALSTRMPVLGLTDPEAYVQRLREVGGEQELRSLLPLVTVGHTEFFRDPKQFKALERFILPQLLAKSRRENRKVVIWSAGCATGEEPYSVAMVMAELGALAMEVDLLATDLNLAAVEAARAGRFSVRRSSGISAERLERFFKPVEEGMEALPALREYVRFDGMNLAAPSFDGMVQQGSLDLILCRNVIIYFDLPTIRGLMDRFLAALRPGGLLFLGYSESLFKVYDRFEMIEVDGAFVYRRPLVEPRPRPAVTATPAPLPSSATNASAAAAAAKARPPENTGTTGSRPAVPGTESLASIRDRLAMGTGLGNSSDPKALPADPPRPTRLTLEMPAVGAPEPRVLRATEVPGGAKTLPPAARLNQAVRKMMQSDFPAAIQDVERLLADEPGHLDALLTLGNLFSLTGKIAEAREAFAQALAREPLCVEARVFGGVAALQAGNLAEARSELSKALFLEPTLAIGHYLLAQVQERTNDRDGARRSYRNAIAQLRFPQRPLAGHYPDIPDSAEAIARVARYALAALED
ncbi:CheR family methyltransferase [Hyalangium rubrum]|uniref:protein-glutamate O-methyltransferase n=1 Tax=Hyalangium rubrum TaxID=3103134 RepID=A0ABU5H4M1_9BACT|nr:CheR family methyltransferase [Hyalangium sp. s54d21]MDY7228052.1 CheR family methyltransferase [Hyalangium sp. s54d21]